MRFTHCAMLLGFAALTWAPSSQAVAQDSAAAEAAPPAAEVAPEPSPQPTEPAPSPATPAPSAAQPVLPAPPATSLEAPKPKPKPWNGPRVELSYRIYSLSDDEGGGAVNSACFSGFLPTRYVRAGGGLEAGGRAYEYGPTEGLMSGNVFVGYQHLHDLGKVVPYVVAVGELGVVFGKRFHTPVSNAIRGAGVEIGADVNLVRSLYVGLGLSFMVYTMDGLAYDTFGLRLSIGL